MLFIYFICLAKLMASQFKVDSNLIEIHSYLYKQL